MPVSRQLSTIILACAAILGIVAALKATEKSITGHDLAAGVANTAESGAPADARTDEKFFSSFIEQAAGALPQSAPAQSAPARPAAAPATPPRTPAKQLTDAVTADAYLVGDVRTGKVYLEKNGLTVLPFASMSKLITALAATDADAPTGLIEVTEPNTEVPADASGLRAGEKFTVQELMYPMLLNSSNVAAEAIASSSDRTHFLELMSGYAWEIGMPGSFFADPTGLSSRNAGTARGFFAMARYLYNDRPDILAITRTVSTSVATTSDHGSHVFTSIHPFVKDPRFLGGKTGHTNEALDTMLTIMNIDDHPIAIIVLHSQNQRAQDTSILIDRVTKLIAKEK